MGWIFPESRDILNSYDENEARIWTNRKYRPPEPIWTNPPGPKSEFFWLDPNDGCSCLECEAAGATGPDEPDSDEVSTDAMTPSSDTQPAAQAAQSSAESLLGRETAALIDVGALCGGDIVAELDEPRTANTYMEPPIPDDAWAKDVLPPASNASQPPASADSTLTLEQALNIRTDSM